MPHHNYDKALPWPFDEEDYIDVVTGRVAREQLRDHPADQPFYMKVSFCGPHKPYDAPQRYLDMFPLEREDDFLLPEGQQITPADKEALWRQRRSSKAMIKLIDDQIGLILDLSLIHISSLRSARSRRIRCSSSKRQSTFSRCRMRWVSPSRQLRSNKAKTTV